MDPRPQSGRGRLRGAAKKITFWSLFCSILRILCLFVAIFYNKKRLCVLCGEYFLIFSLSFVWKSVNILVCLPAGKRKTPVGEDDISVCMSYAAAQQGLRASQPNQLYSFVNSALCLFYTLYAVRYTLYKMIRAKNHFMLSKARKVSKANF